MVTAVQRARSTNLRQRILIIVQNLPVPFDRRVWLECQTLTVVATTSRLSAREARIRCRTRSSTT